MKREDSKRLKEKKQELLRLMKQKTKDLGYKTSNGYTYKFASDFAYWVDYGLRFDDAMQLILYANVYLKSLELDKVYWDVFQIEDAERQPKSFHIYGAFTSSFAAAGISVKEAVSDGLEEAVTMVFERVGKGISDMEANVKSVSNYDDLVKNSPGGTMNHILALIYKKDYDKAAETITEEQEKGHSGGFADSGGKTFYDYALEHCKCSACIDICN